ncbi:unnamed protein product [Cuscuta epithymum]|uniref:Uncharacterized protein n=2 Tax=Cuscuta epithymum TaxID=186058 RepID=A0AAV0FXH3_9ASTE|nr:unnamed protein product [Cuscuta epithymum]
MVIICGVQYERIIVGRSLRYNPGDFSITLSNLIGYKGEEIQFEWSNHNVTIIGWAQRNRTWFEDCIHLPHIITMGVIETKFDDERGILYIKLSKHAIDKIDPATTVSVQELLDQQTPSSSGGGRKDSSQNNHTKGGGATKKRIKEAELTWQEDDERSSSWRVFENLKMGLKIILVVIVTLGLFRLIEIQKRINQ